MFDKGKDALQDLGNDAIDAASGAVTDALDIKDFYSAHLMTFCEGNFKPNAQDPKADEEVTACSERKAFYTFDPTAIIESKLPKGLGLSDIKWPEEITNGVKAINVASKAMFFFYIIGIAAAGIGMIGAVFGILAYEHKVALANLGINSVSTFETSNSLSIDQFTAWLSLSRSRLCDCDSRHLPRYAGSQRVRWRHRTSG